MASATSVNFRLCRRALGQNAFGLLEGQPLVERGLQLFGRQLSLAQGAFLQQPDGGHVGQRLRDRQALGIETAARHREQIHSANDLFAQPHRQRVHGREPGIEGLGDEISATGRTRRKDPDN